MHVLGISHEITLETLPGSLQCLFLNLVVIREQGLKFRARLGIKRFFIVISVFR